MVDQVEPLTPRRASIQLDLPTGSRRRPEARSSNRNVAQPLPSRQIGPLNRIDAVEAVLEAVDEPVVINDSPPLAPRTEYWNTVTHGMAGVLGVFALLAIGTKLTITAASPLMWAAGLFYGCSLAYLYVASGMSHWYSWKYDAAARGYWRRQDQVGILLVAVSSFAPLALHARGVGLLVLPLMAAAVAALLIALCRHEKRTINPIYLAQLGWLPPLATSDIARIAGGTGLFLAVAGGALYVGGLFFLFGDSRRWWFHPVWHLCAMTGSALHFTFLFGWCL